MVANAGQRGIAALVEQTEDEIAFVQQSRGVAFEDERKLGPIPGAPELTEASPGEFHELAEQHEKFLARDDFDGREVRQVSVRQRWFIAEALFDAHARRPTGSSFTRLDRERLLFLVRARDHESAVRKAQAIAKDKEHSYANVEGEDVSWTLRDMLKSRS